MNKTQLLSETENLIYCLGKNTIYNETGISYLIQQLGTTASRNDKQEVLLLLHFWRHFTHFYNTVHESYNKNTYLTSQIINAQHLIIIFSIVNGKGCHSNSFIQIIYFKSLSYTWYFLNWKWYKQSTNYFTQKKNKKNNNPIKSNTIKLL